MNNPRLLYRVILKFFALIGGFVLLYVMVSSLFTNETKSSRQDKTVVTVKLDLTGMTNGKIRKIRWRGRDVIITKSVDSNFNVFFNTGDSGNCPLFYSSEGFKDTCTGTLYDPKGREKNKQQAKKLESPDYYFEGSFIIIGKRK